MDYVLIKSHCIKRSSSSFAMRVTCWMRAAAARREEEINKSLPQVLLLIYSGSGYSTLSRPTHVFSRLTRHEEALKIIIFASRALRTFIESFLLILRTNVDGVRRNWALPRLVLSKRPQRNHLNRSNLALWRNWSIPANKSRRRIPQCSDMSESRYTLLKLSLHTEQLWNQKHSIMKALRITAKHINCIKQLDDSRAHTEVINDNYECRCSVIA